MAVLAAATGVIAVLAGISISLETDAPTGPLIVCTLAAMFALSTLFRQRFLR